MTSVLQVCWMGRVAYEEAYALQCALLRQRHERAILDTLILLEHPHVYTLGRRSRNEDVLVGQDGLRSLGAQVIATDRGGETTYHGPGQLVGYPIIDLKAARMGAVQYVRLLEGVLIETLARFGIHAQSIEGKTGVWTQGVGHQDFSEANPDLRKIAAIGVRISRGITMHGFAMNVAPDLSYFQHIVPCGMKDLMVASIASLTGKQPAVEEVADDVALVFAEALGRRRTSITVDELAA